MSKKSKDYFGSNCSDPLYRCVKEGYDEHNKADKDTDGKENGTPTEYSDETNKTPTSGSGTVFAFTALLLFPIAFLVLFSLFSSSDSFNEGIFFILLIVIFILIMIGKK